MKRFLTVLVLLITTISFAESKAGKNLNEKYILKEVVVLSRHNIRAPLSSKESALGKATNVEFIEWSAPKSELTSKGGVLETIMGQYFREWLQSENLLDFKTCPNRDEVLIYANSMQRTIATANYFKTGFYPTCNLEVQHRYAPSKMDPTFHPKLTKNSKEFQELAMKQINALDNKTSLEELTKSLKPSFELIEEVVDMKNSEECKKNGKCKLDDYKTEMVFKLNDEPNLKGSLKLGTIIADALVLQYFEEPDDSKAAFGRVLTTEEWEKISKVKDVYGDVLFTPEIVAQNVAHPLLRYIYDELNHNNRKFVYLVGHDSNLGSVTSALGVLDYSLPNTIEKKTPIGSKLVFEKWENKETKELYVGINMVYQSTQQLRNTEQLSMKNKPMIFPMKFKGLKANKDGLYPLEEVNKMFLKAIRSYDNIK